MALAMAFAGAASAQLDLPPEGAPTGAMKVYFVSAVLQKTGEAGVIKLVHSVRTAASARIAADTFEGLIRKDFPDYVVATTLVSREADIKLPACARGKLGSEI